MEKNFVGLVTDFVGDFLDNEDNSSNVGNWLSGAMTKFMPEMSADEASKNSKTIVDTVRNLNDKLRSVQQAVSPQSWFREEFNELTQNCSIAEKGKMLSQAFNGLSEAESNFTGETAETAGEIPDDAWNNFTLMQMASDVVKKSGKVALESLASHSTDAIQQTVEGVIPMEKIKNTLTTSSIGTAVDTGVKCAASGAALIAQKKGWLKNFIPADAGVQEIANIAVGAVENVKIFLSVGSGNCSTEEAIDRVQRNFIARTVDFLAVSSPSIGRKIGSVFGPHGAVIGEAIGRGVSFLAKTDAREFFEKGLNKVCTGARNLVSKGKAAVKAGVNKVKNAFKSLFS